jgi:hypothetical protein
MKKLGDKKTTEFVSYLDDNGKHKQVYVDIIEINPSYITFRTYSNNIITIPMIRVLKIKRKEGDDVNE